MRPQRTDTRSVGDGYNHGLKRRHFLGIAAWSAIGAMPVGVWGQPSEQRRPPLSRELQLQLVDQTSVLDFMSEAQKADVLSGKGAVDVTAAIQACLDAVAGQHRTVRFPPGTYLMGRAFPRSHTILWLDGQTTLRKKVDGISLLRLANVENVHILANGARLEATAHDGSSSHTVYFDSARQCSIRDANVIGAGNRKDCIYIGEGGQGPSQDVLILGGSCVGARRNGISVVSGFRTLIDGVTISGTTGAPGAGIDVESNVYDRAVDTEIRNCRVHGNQSYGIVVVFGHRVRIHHNDVFGNLQDGIGAAAGGTQFDAGVYRPNVDLRGVARFDPATGRVLVGGGAATLPIGTVILFKAAKAGVVPATFGTRRWIVNDTRESSGGLEVLLGGAVGYDVKTQLSDGGAGRLTLDPASSEVQMVCFVEGQCSGIEIYDNRISGNLRRGISIITAVDVSIRSNQIAHGGSMSAVQVSYVRAAELRSNVMSYPGSGASSPTAAGASPAGVLIAASALIASRSNRVTGFPGPGIDLAGASGARLEGDTVTNCGSRTGIPVRLRQASDLTVSTLRIANDPPHPVMYGLKTEAVTRSTFTSVDATGTGSSNSNSISVEDNQVLNSRLRDGSLHSSRPLR